MRRYIIENSTEMKEKYREEIDRVLQTLSMVSFTGEDDEICKQKARQNIINSRIGMNTVDNLYERMQDLTLELIKSYSIYNYMSHPEGFTDDWELRLAEALKEPQSVKAEITYNGKSKEIRLFTWRVMKSLAFCEPLSCKAFPTKGVYYSILAELGVPSGESLNCENISKVNVRGKVVYER